ncbi:MAG: HAMP domain-containing sensor histidine kinase [Reichenbachiella sp.]|uniref:sensor histidine kinase n=1 Tax=Reichenbachiella sp. TaxID=2184521 RepID=UPI002965E430|nr:HAMP domain-containing sensor histidine kinase [Reichenbachiella sp.]MDW3210656.1 HAMP domain-containing sensor histidine kinase [Reichenbachiella sp.]
MARKGFTYKLKDFYSLGCSDSLNIYEVCKLGIINRLTLICILLALLLITVNLSIGNYQGILIDILAILTVLIPVLTLNYFHKYRAAEYVFLWGIHLAVVAGAIHAAFENRPNEIELLLIPSAIAVVILIDGFGQWLLFISNLMAFLILKYFIAGLDNLGYIKLVAIVAIAYTGIYYFVIQFKTQLIRALHKTERLNEELIEKEKALTESNLSKDKLFSIVAHDLRSPLGLIQSLLDPSLINSLDRQKFMDYQATIRSRFKVLQENMNNLLAWAQSQLGNSKRIVSHFDLVTEVVKIIDLFEEMTASKQIKMIRIGKEERMVNLDKNHLNIILRNLVHNAIKFTPENGAIDINIEEHAGATLIQIIDSGKGVNDEMKTKILNSKLMESGIGTQGERGSGVGLSFCQELIKKNKGELRIIDNSSGGAIFEVRFPTI